MSREKLLVILVIAVAKVSTQIVPRNQYVGIEQDFQFYNPTVHQTDTSRGNNHRFQAQQRPAPHIPHIPTSLPSGASLVSIEAQNIEDYYENNPEEPPRTLEEQRRIAEQYQIAQETYRKDEEYRRESLRQIEQQEIERTRQRPNPARHQPAHFEAPTPAARPLESLTHFVGTNEQPQQQQHFPQRHQQPEQHQQHFPQRHQQPEQPQQHFPQRHQQPAQHRSFNDQHVIQPRPRTSRPKIDPFATLGDFPASRQTQQPRQPQRVTQQPQQFPQEVVEDEYVPQSLFARVDPTQQARRPPQTAQRQAPRTPQRSNPAEPEFQPRPAPPRPTPPPAQPRPQSLSSRGNFQAQGSPQNQRDYEEKLFRQQADNAQYQFASDIHDDINGNHQGRQEVRDGANVKGMYSYSDGFYKRTVFYEADEKGYRVVK